jgi:hypothetical protein
MIPSFWWPGRLGTDKIIQDMKPFVFEPLNLPVFDVPQKEHWPCAITWKRAMEEFEPLRFHYMKHHDSPERRLRNKNPEPFRMHSSDFHHPG